MNDRWDDEEATGVLRAALAEIDALSDELSPARAEALLDEFDRWCRSWAREPSPEEIAELMEIPLDKVQRAPKIVKEPISLETSIGNEEQSSLADFVEDELAPSPVEAAIRGNLGEQTRKVLATLTPREEQILRMRFGIGQKTDYTLEEVGKQFAVTRERIRQIEAKALRKLRQKRALG